MTMRFYIITPVEGPVPDVSEIVGTLDDQGKYSGRPETGERIQEYVERYGLDLTDKDDRIRLMMLFSGHYSGAIESESNHCPTGP